MVNKGKDQRQRPTDNATKNKSNQGAGLVKRCEHAFENVSLVYMPLQTMCTTLGLSGIEVN